MDVTRTSWCVFIQASRKHPGTAAGSRKVQRWQGGAAAAAAVRQSPSSSQTFPTYNKNNKGQQACYCGVTGARRRRAGRARPEKDTSAHLRVAKEAGAAVTKGAHALGGAASRSAFKTGVRRVTVSPFNRLKYRWQSSEVWGTVNCTEICKYMHIKPHSVLNSVQFPGLNWNDEQFTTVTSSVSVPRSVLVFRGAQIFSQHCTCKYSTVYLLRDLLSPGPWQLLYLSSLLSWACGLNQHPLFGYKTWLHYIGRARTRTCTHCFRRVISRPHTHTRRRPVIRRWMTTGCWVSIIGCNDTKPPTGTHCRRWTFGFLESILVSYKWMTVLIGWLRPDLRRGRNDLAILSRDDSCVQIHERHECGEAWMCMRHLWNYSGLLCVVTIWFSFGCFFCLGVTMVIKQITKSW